MNIYVDADACPVVDLTERIAGKYGIACTLLCDCNHLICSDYSKVITVDQGADAVDFKLITLIQKGDLCVTQDYGVAAMALGKGAFAIHPRGFCYSNENIDRLLMERHLAKKERAKGKHAHRKGPARRTAEDDSRFAQTLEKVIGMASGERTQE